MDNDLTLGELFAGVGGFSLGFDAAGWTTRWQVEWNPECQAVLRRHWPDATKYTDVREVRTADLAPVTAITFGSPCQDLSVAGKRRGLDGSRSSLFYEAIRIIREMRAEHSLPTLAVWENVGGALSSNGGRDFAAALDALADLGAMAIGWRVLDARHFGTAQRRKRVFVVASFGTRCADSLLLEPLGDRWGTEMVSGHRQDHPHASPRGLGEGVYALQNTVRGRAATSGPGRGYGHLDGPMYTLDLWGPHAIVPLTARPRLITPREAERLMGWPDDHTRYRDDGTELPDRTRYAQCGNGVAAPVAQWLAATLAHALKEPTT